jgi:murein L,D-transpeptidase YcbB/YkuD
VYLLYWTAWANEDGVIHFHKDIYDRDKVLDKALREFNPPSRGKDNVEMVLKH